MKDSATPTVDCAESDDLTGVDVRVSIGRWRGIARESQRGPARIVILIIGGDGFVSRSERISRYCRLACRDD